MLALGETRCCQERAELTFAQQHGVFIEFTAIHHQPRDRIQGIVLEDCDQTTRTCYAREFGNEDTPCQW